MFKSVARNFSILTSATLLEAAITFLFLAFVARKFGPSLFGKYILINVYVTVASVLVNAGVVPIAFRELARHRDNAGEMFDDLFSLRLVLGVVSYLALMITAAFAIDDTEYLALVAVAGVGLLIEPFAGSFRAYYTAHERMAIPSTYSIASAGLSAIAGGALLIAGFGLFALLISNVASALAITAIWTMRFRSRVLRFRFRARFDAWKRLLLLILPFAPIHASSQINRVLNIFFLGRIDGPLPTERAVGYYGPANSVANTVVKLVMGMRRALIPPVTVKLSQGHSVAYEINMAMKLVIALFCLPLILGTTYMSAEIILLLFGDQYGPSNVVLSLLGWAGALQIAAFVPESFLFSHPDHKLHQYIGGSLTSVFVNALLCILLINEYGIVGAAAAAIAARFVYFLFVGHYYRKQIPGQALSLNSFWDVTALAVSSFGVWHLMFTWFPSSWVALTLASVVTLLLMATFVLYLRLQSRVRAPA